MKLRFAVVSYASRVTLLFLSLATPAFGQKSAPLKGVILDWQSSAVSRALVTVKDGERKYFAYPDESGGFQLNVLEGSYKLIVDSTGFKKYVIDEIDIGQAPEAYLIIQLELERWQTDICPIEPRGGFKIERADAPPSEKIAARKIQ